MLLLFCVVFRSVLNNVDEVWNSQYCFSVSLHVWKKWMKYNTATIQHNFFFFATRRKDVQRVSSTHTCCFVLAVTRLKIVQVVWPGDCAGSMIFRLYKFVFFSVQVWKIWMECDIPCAHTCCFVYFVSRLKGVSTWTRYSQWTNLFWLQLFVTRLQSVNAV